MNYFNSIVLGRLISHISELSDVDYRYVSTFYSLPDNKNKHTFPNLKYTFKNGTGMNKVFVDFGDGAEHHIGHYGLHYLETGTEISLSIHSGFFNKNTFNVLSTFAKTDQQEETLFDNILYLTKVLKYTNNSINLDSIEFKFHAAYSFNLVKYFIEHKSYLIISDNDEILRYSYDFCIYENVYSNVNRIHLSYKCDIKNKKFKTLLESCISLSTLEAFGKKFSKLNEDELKVFQMMNF